MLTSARCCCPAQWAQWKNTQLSDSFQHKNSRQRWDDAVQRTIKCADYFLTRDSRAYYRHHILFHCVFFLHISLDVAGSGMINIFPKIKLIRLNNSYSWAWWLKSRSLSAAVTQCGCELCIIFDDLGGIFRSILLASGEKNKRQQQ